MVDACKPQFLIGQQEPVIYVDGQPCAPRQPDRMHENLFLDASITDLDNLEETFANIVKERVKNDPEHQLDINHDQQYMENPLERENVEEKVSVAEVKSLEEMFAGYKKKLGHMDLVRIPVVEDFAPKEACIDILVDSLKQEPASTQCVFSCQAGMGRTTLGNTLSLVIV